jgi:hypothetical protein
MIPKLFQDASIRQAHPGVDDCPGCEKQLSINLRRLHDRGRHPTPGTEAVRSDRRAQPYQDQINRFCNRTWIRGLLDPAANARDRHDGYRLMDMYRKLGLHLEAMDPSVESGILQVGQRMSSGSRKVFPSLVKYTPSPNPPRTIRPPPAPEGGWHGKVNIRRRRQKLVRKHSVLPDPTRPRSLHP